MSRVGNRGRQCRACVAYVRTGLKALAFSLVVVAWSTVALAQPAWTPPAEPSVKPQIPDVTEMDVDANGIDDRIDESVDALESEIQAAPSPARMGELNTLLVQPIRIELVFASQITQQQIDDFLALGGTIDHMFQSVSYGWTGRLPRSAVNGLPARMGASLVVVMEERATQWHLDEATRTGRVRPVWVSGFAGSVPAFDGDSNITIAVIDTGLDDAHTDLSGRNEYWKDYTSDLEGTPRDIIQHGTHVAGIAVGTGAALGSATATLTYTDSNDASALSPGFGYTSYIHLPAVSLTYTQDATWLGGGSTDLYGTFSPNGAGGLSALSAPTFGASGIIESNTFTPSSANRYSSFLAQNAGATMTRYATVNTVTNYPAVGDSFNILRGVCPACRWAGAKVFTNAGTGSNLDIHAAMDDMVTQRSLHNIKVANLSLGTIGAPGIDTTERAKANTMVDNGIVTVVSAGNDGPGTGGANVIDDPGRAAKVLTVAASNDINELTVYTSSGFAAPGSDEDNKPDVMAPGGSSFYSQILSADSNDADAESTGFADRVSNDYYNINGTSMAAPFAAGAAALVIDAMQQAGTVWSFASSTHSLFVKMLLCASATESNANREVGSGTDPSLGRAATPKDLFEGYGMINPDAAIEAVSLNYSGAALSDTTAGGVFDRRAWGRNISLVASVNTTLILTVPATADYDLYLYSETPDSKGNPVILASSTNAGLGTDESINFTPSISETGYVFIKRVTGNGTWSLSGTVGPTPVPTPTNTPAPPATCGATPIGGCDGPGKSIILLKNDTDNLKDKLLWKWLKGPFMTQGDFGNPDTGTTGYTLCIYDDDNIEESVVVPPVTNWNPISNKGYLYKDSTGSLFGITKILMKGGAAGKSKILVKGKGGTLPQPALMFSQSIDVTVQLLRNDGSQCWEAVFSPPAIKTTGTQFKDKF